MKSPPQKKRIRNPAQTRAKLLQATIDLVVEKGAGALSMKEAALAANVSRAVAYQHFDDRDHLLQEAKTWISNRLLESVVDLDSASMEDRVEHVARLVLSNREASRLLIADALAGKDLDTDHPLHRLLLQTLEEFKASGNARTDIDVEIMSFIMLGTVSTLIMLSRPRANTDIAALAQRFTTEWTRILRQGIFLEGKQRAVYGSRAARASRPRLEADPRRDKGPTANRSRKKTHN